MFRFYKAFIYLSIKFINITTYNIITFKLLQHVILVMQSNVIDTALQIINCNYWAGHYVVGL